MRNRIQLVWSKHGLTLLLASRSEHLTHLEKLFDAEVPLLYAAKKGKLSSFVTSEAQQLLQHRCAFNIPPEVDPSDLIPKYSEWYFDVLLASGLVKLFH